MRNNSISRKTFEVLNYTFLTVCALLIIMPFVNVISISLSSVDALNSGSVKFFPMEFNIKAYTMLMGNLFFLRAMLNTVFLTILNTTLVITTSLLSAYALSNQYFIGRKIAIFYILIPMYFSGGLIPTYLVVTGVGLNNSLFALVLPAITNVFLIIVFRNAILQLPRDLFHSAEIDGAGDFSILFKIVIPLMMPMVAAFIIFSAVAYWNEWFGCLLYIRDPNKYTLQFRLRELIANANMEFSSRNLLKSTDLIQSIHPQNIRTAALMITVIPIIAIYPFLQKYFIHGVIVGAIKG